MRIDSRSFKVSSVLEMVGEAKSKKEKLDILIKYNCLALRDILKGAFDDTIQWELPEGAPPYTPFESSQDLQPKYINKVTKRLSYFVKGSPNLIQNHIRRERFFVETIEVIHPEDAELIILMKDKALGGKYKGLTKKLVQDAFPGLIVR